MTEPEFMEPDTNGETTQADVSEDTREDATAETETTGRHAFSGE